MSDTFSRPGQVRKATWVEYCTKADGTALTEDEVIRDNYPIIENHATIREQNNTLREVE